MERSMCGMNDLIGVSVLLRTRLFVNLVDFPLAQCEVERRRCPEKAAVEIKFYAGELWLGILSGVQADRARGKLLAGYSSSNWPLSQPELPTINRVLVACVFPAKARNPLYRGR
jgi:hypothetical protein